MVDESSSAIQSLNGETTGLNALVSQFVLGDGSGQTQEVGDGEADGPEAGVVAEVDDFEVDAMSWEEEEPFSRSA